MTGGLPDLPYNPGNPSSGFSGSSTSEATARDQDADGRTKGKQVDALRQLSFLFRRGLTWRELDELKGWGHGSTSRVLSDLHKTGRIARLTEERNRCKVYVLPEYVNGRPTEPHGGKGKAAADQLQQDVLRQEVRAAISNAYYQARNEGRTMEAAATAAADAVMLLVRP